MGQLVFEPEEHVYSVDGEVLPSVTGIVDSAGLFPFGRANESPTFYMERGRVVHSVCQFDDEGTLDEETVDEIAAPRLEAWRKFRRESKVKIIANETPLWHPRLRYAGTLDRLVLWNGDYCILDLKCGQHVRAYGIQTAGYEMLVELPESIEALELDKPLLGVKLRRYGIHLADTGTYKIVEHVRQKDRATFKHCLGIHEWKKEDAA